MRLLVPRVSVRQVIGGIASFVILGAILALFFAYRHQAMTLHQPPVRFPVRLSYLPYYAFCSFNRMLAAYVFALIFSIVYGMVAARGGVWERVMIPIVDIGQ